MSTSPPQNDESRSISANKNTPINEVFRGNSAKRVTPDLSINKKYSISKKFVTAQLWKIKSSPFRRGLVALNLSGRVAFLPTAAFIINLYPSLLALEVFLIGLILDYMNYSIILLNCEYPKAQQ